MSQVPYDPLLDQGQQLPVHSNPTSNSHHSTPHITAQDLDDPVQYQPPPRGASNPNLYAAGGLGAAGVGGAAGMAGVGLGGQYNGSADFNPPAPHFINNATRSSTYSSSTLGGGDRQSGYGSIAALRDSRYETSGGSGAGGAGTPTGEHGYYPPQAGGRPYTDDPSGRSGRDMSEKDELYEAPRAKTKRKGVLWAGICVALVVLIAAIALPVYFLVIKPKSGGSSSSSSSSNSGGNTPGASTSSGPGTTQAITTGGDGSIVSKEDGSTFVYNNTLGGYWVYDPNNPLNESARAQSYSPPLSQPWKWGVDRVYGVNIGGWLNLEPFISPALYEPFFPNAVDEWTLSTLIQARDGNLNAIENHYATFIVEEDFAQIAAAGLNWVRIPLPFWAINKLASEPFLERKSWNYFLKAIEWARKYGLRINLDFHAVPGSQNGWNHSGKLGDVNFLNGVMGLANGQRTLDYIRVLAEFISQPEYRNVVPFFGILNEPQGGTGAGSIPKAALQAFYAEAYRIIRTAGGSGKGNGPVISLHESFFGLGDWTGFLTGADRLALDSHPYLVFGSFPAGNPSDFASSPCGNWAGLFGGSMSAFGITAAGEWSHAINDCGLYVNAVNVGTRYEGTFQTTTRLGSCDSWNDYTTWDQSIKDGLKQLSMSTMDALGDWFFWTWRIGPSLAKGRVEAPFWSYKLAIEQGWAVTDPRQSKGQCQRLGSSGNSFYEGGGTFSGAQVGDGVADAIADVPSLAAQVWPPAAIGGFPNAATLPTYTATGPIPTLPVTPDLPASLTRSAVQPTQTVNMGNGWNNAADQGLMHVPAPGCAYPDAWNANNAAVPSC